MKLRKYILGGIAFYLFLLFIGVALFDPDNWSNDIRAAFISIIFLTLSILGFISLYTKTKITWWYNSIIFSIMGALILGIFASAVFFQTPDCGLTAIYSMIYSLIGLCMCFFAWKFIRSKDVHNYFHS